MILGQVRMRARQTKNAPLDGGIRDSTNATWKQCFIMESMLGVNPVCQRLQVFSLKFLRRPGGLVATGQTAIDGQTRRQEQDQQHHYEGSMYNSQVHTHTRWCAGERTGHLRGTLMPIEQRATIVAQGGYCTALCAREEIRPPRECWNSP